MKKLLTLFIATLLIPTSIFALNLATLNIIPPKENCKVWIDNTQVGEGNTVTTVSAGSHDLMVYLNDGTLIYDRTVFLGSGENKTITVPYKGDYPLQNKTVETVRKEEIKQPKGLDEEKDRTFFEIAPEISNFTYKEATLMQDSGMMKGIRLSYTKHGKDKNMYRLECRYSYGQVDYDGALSDGTPYRIKGINDRVWEVRGLFGHDFSFSSTSNISPFIGIGYRFLSDNGQEIDPAAYKREANYLYSPIGVESVTSIGGFNSIVFNIEYDYFHWGKEYTYLSTWNPAAPDNVYEQTGGSGMRGSIKYSGRENNLDYAFELFVRNWEINKSKEQVDIIPPFIITSWEPKNLTWENGISFIMRF